MKIEVAGQQQDTDCMVRKPTATGKPIAVIAAGCGFADQAHLTRHMHAAFGVTPAAYRWQRQR